MASEMTWHQLTRVVRVADEATCQELMHEELVGRARLRHLLRIHSRINKIRAERERIQLMSVAKE